MTLPDEMFVALMSAISTEVAQTIRLLGFAERLEDVEAEREYIKKIRLLEESRRLLIAWQFN